MTVARSVIGWPQGSGSENDERKCSSECAIKSLMKHRAGRKKITSSIFRPGDPVPDQQYWDNATPEERMNAVWELTLLCLAWQPNQADEPRLQRSISRIQRPTS